MKTIFCLLALFVGTTFADKDSEWLKSLEKSFATVKTVQARLRQEKKLKMFNRTIIMTGRIALEHPGKLAWRFDKPIKYTLIIDGKIARQWDEESKKVQKIKTQKDPIFKEVIGQIEKWFSGDFSALLKEYTLTVKSKNPPVLEFIPKSDGMVHKVIKKLTIHIRPDLRYVEKINIEDAGGDQTIITFLDTRLNEPIPASEWEISPNG